MSSAKTQMPAVLLAAGRGRRLESDRPKCLLEIAGKTLLERHVANLEQAGVTALTIVVGYEQGQIREFVAARIESRLPIDFVENPDFIRGSIVSLGKAMHVLTVAGGIYMDADVLYPAALMRRLVESPHANCVLVDPSSNESGEEMMVGIRDGRVHAIARRVSPLGPWDLAGEAVGFAKVGAQCAEILRKSIEAEIAAGRLDQDYEMAMNAAFAAIPWGHELVSDFEWTEIDFQEDVERARSIAASLG